MGLDEIWDRVVEELEYFISFEWIGDTLEFFSGMFDNLSELSIVGTIYGIIMVGLVYALRAQVFVFVETLGAGAKIFWYPVFYIFSFGMGYVMGRKIWE